MITQLGAPMICAFLAGKKLRTRRTNLARWAKVKPGDLVVFKENYWRRSYWLNGEPIRGMSVTDDVRYMATDPRPASSNPEEVFWEPRKATFMPKFAWRCFATVDSIVLEPLQNITEQEAVLEGATSRREFATIWDSINRKNPADLFSANPTVVAVAFTPITKEEYVERSVR
jgi:hypothetical protein